NSGKVYGTADPALTATQIGFTAADAATIGLSSTRATGENVGNYVITPSASGAALSNYNVNYMTGTFAISKAVATVTAKNSSKTYGDTVTFAGTEFTTAGFLEGDGVASATLSSTGAGATAAAG